MNAVLPTFLALENAKSEKLTFKQIPMGLKLNLPKIQNKIHLATLTSGSRWSSISSLSLYHSGDAYWLEAIR